LNVTLSDQGPVLCICKGGIHEGQEMCHGPSASHLTKKEFGQLGFIFWSYSSQTPDILTGEMHNKNV
jgi:hypothetical protein